MTRIPLVATVLIALLIPAGSAFGDPLPQQSVRVVEYAIDVALDVEKKELKGRERLVWHNPSQDSVGDLWFHLYLNAFRNNRSTFFRESGGQLRNDQMPEGGWGWIDVTSMKLADGTDVTRALTFEAPDDGNRDDRTVVKVVLPQPVGPGGSVALDITFSAKLPRVFARTGYERDYFLVGQWFPKIGVYEPAGMRGRPSGGWNCHQFHAHSEFYADYGSYRVAITLPSRFVVGATGRRTSLAQHANGTSTHTFEQHDVHDFAWTAQPDFVEVADTFSATRDVSPQEYAETAALVGRTVEDVRLSDVAIRLLLQPQHRPQADRYMQAAKLGLKYFGLWYGRYPYATLTVVDPAYGAGGSGGMEYPTLITGGTTVLFNRWPLNQVRAPELVTVHEFGHQFWYGLVGNNEFEEAWLDEGVNSYSTGRVIDLAYGTDVSNAYLLGFKVGEEDQIRVQNSPRRLFDRVRQPAWSYSPGAYSFYSYTKPELLLRTLEHYLGRQVMARVMRTYHERWRFRHPSSDDFYAVASEVAGQDLGWFFSQAVEGTDVLDYSIASYESQPVRPADGYLEKDGRWRVTGREEHDKAARLAREKGPFETRVVVRRLGGMTFPVTLQLTFEDGKSERLAWDGRDRWKTFVVTRPSRLARADIDPDRRVTMEVDWLNNSRRTKPDSRVTVLWTTRWAFWLQNLLAVVGL